MPHDVEASYARLLLLIERRHVFPAGAPMADWACHAIVKAQVLICDLDSLREVHGAVGREMLVETLLRLRRSDLFDVADVLDPYAELPTSATQETLANHVADLAAGQRPAFPPVEAATLDLKGMRRLRAQREEHFDAWLAGLRDAEAKALVRRIDPWLPGVRNMGGTDSLARLSALAEGCGTVPDIDLSRIDRKGLRAARRLMGDHTFALWANRQRHGVVKAFAKRNAHGGKGTKAEAPEGHAAVLNAIADGRKPPSGKALAKAVKAKGQGPDASAAKPTKGTGNRTRRPLAKGVGRNGKRAARKAPKPA